MRLVELLAERWGAEWTDIEVVWSEVVIGVDFARRPGPLRAQQD